jgi:hypothetical protein
MQFNKKIAVTYNTRNEHDELEPVEDKELRCCIIEQHRSTQETGDGKRRAYDLKFIVSNRSFAPYKDLFTSDTLTFTYDGVQYDPVLLTSINESSGKVKYYEVRLAEKRVQ